VVDAAVIFGALMGAIVWNLITWAMGIPSSSSHALIGGLAGAGFMKAGFGAIVWTGLSFVRSTPVAVDNFFRVLQFLSAALTRLHPVQGFCAEAGGAATLFLATAFGIPVSTTHTITGAIVGVGAARKVAAVRWNVASDVVVAWILTMPATALIGAIFYKLYDALW
jgi:PiT family inorganic phosphate transporter